MQKKIAYELAMWTAKENPDENRDLIVNLTNTGLESLPGMIKRTIFQSTTDLKLLFDWVEWDSLLHAEQAAQNMMSVPELQTFVQLIDRTERFEHYHFADSHILDDREEGIVELAVYSLQPDADVVHFFSAYSQAVTGLDGYRKRYLFRNTKDANSWTELAYWESEEKARGAAQALEKDPEIGQALKMVADTEILHQYFRIFN